LIEAIWVYNPLLFGKGKHVSSYIRIRVYYDDTDAGGVVNHSNYLKFFERGRTEMLRDSGISLVSLFTDHGAQFVVHSANLAFLQPARLDQLLYVRTEIDMVRHASILYKQQIHLENERGPIVCKATVRIACLDLAFRPRELPEVVSREVRK
jgi:acyl-CoA thioester hydrolase